MKLYGRSATPRTVEILIRQRIPPTSEVRTIVECKYLNLVGPVLTGVIGRQSGSVRPSVIRRSIRWQATAA